MEPITTDALTLLLNPDPAGPARLAEEVVAALAAVPGVRAMALFGSLAEGRADRWSDVDLIVGCDEVEALQWAAAQAVRALRPVLLYRKFSAVEQPSGRFWFADTSLFHRLDISFIALERYHERLRCRIENDHLITYQQIYAASPSTQLPPACPTPLAITARETEVGLWVYRLLNALKARLRGQITLEELTPTVEGLRAMLAELPRDAVMAGGQIGAFAYRLLEMADAVVE